MWNAVFLSYITDTDNDMTFSVLHIKGNRPVIEPTVDHSGSHVKWNVTSLSPVGPIIQTSQAVEHHGVVLVYKQLTTDNNSYSFHVYLGTNSASDIKVSGVFQKDLQPALFWLSVDLRCISKPDIWFWKFGQI